ncbi:hypothetical protein [Methylomarinum vadi]|uniref:hypothetical protein n=1 Tax=Methylomarinum vadi TaxID=438855 RepID=UPI00190F2204|nr:hypothetical protein [Methylomarinum vadi]
MKNLPKDIVNGLLSMVAIFGFISGEFILSTVLFATAALLANIDLNNRRLDHAENLSSR